MRPRIDVRRGLAEFERSVDRLHRQQLPYAASLALNAVAKKVAAAEAEGLKEAFDKPTTFTLNAFSVLPARKTRLTATVFVKDRQAAYLEPYMDGGSGRQVLGDKRAILAPRNIPLNSFGNIPRGKLAALKGRRDIFIGPITTSSGQVINGVWQRPTPAPVRVKGQRTTADRLANRTGKLRLLIQFDDPRPVRPRLRYGERAAEVVARELMPELRAALERALATAR